MKNIKIFHIGIFTRYKIDGDWILYNGFKKLKYSIKRFNYRKISGLTNVKLMNKLLLKQVQRYKPDLILIGKGEQLYKETLQKIKIKSNPIIVLWHGDQRPSLEKNLLELCEVADWLFHTTGGSRLKEYHDLTKVNSAFFIFPTDPSIFYKKPVSKKWQSDILFTGSKHPYISEERKILIDMLLKRPDFKIYGNGYGKIIKGKKYLKAIRGTKIGLSINAFNNFKYYTSERLMNYMSCGTFTLSSFSPGLDLIFKNKKELVFFNNNEECIEYIDYYLKNDKERELIAFNGMKKYHEIINNVNTVKEMLNIIYNNKASFPWSETYT